MISYIFMIIGLLAIALGFVVYGGENISRVWANLLLNSVFFQGIAMAGAFFLAATYVAWGGWHTVLKRVPEALSLVIPFTAVILLVVILAGGHHLYHWMDTAHVEHDPILKGKQPYLNLPFFLVRFAFFLGILILLTFLMRKNSLREDQGNELTSHKANLKWASLFLVFFAVYISVSAWDWLMSIDAHWYSTMYGWYSFASFWVSGLAVITLVVLYLKSKGYLQVVNNSHLHDLGKLMFAFSIFWTYLTFCQFMLIWYANIPEETAYFRERYDHFKPLFYAIFLLNFLSPFLILMSRDSKRHFRMLAIASFVILIGHYLDFYLMIMPGVVGSQAGFGFLEIVAPFFWIGLLMLLVFRNFSKAAQVPVNHPFLQESLHHST
jgi:hypothetical protein